MQGSSFLEFPFKIWCKTMLIPDYGSRASDVNSLSYVGLSASSRTSGRCGMLLMMSMMVCSKAPSSAQPNVSGLMGHLYGG